MRVANAATVTGREPVPYSTPAPADLPTEPRTGDVEAWRSRVDERREATRRSREVAQAAWAADYAAATAGSEAVATQAPNVPAPIQDRIDAARPAPPPAPPPARWGGPRTAMSSTEIASAVTAYLGGATIPAIADATGRGTRTIRSALLAAGVTLRDDRRGHSGSKPKTAADDDPAVVAQVRRLYLDEGLTQAEVAERVGLGTHGVQGIMARHDIPARPPATELDSPRVDGAKTLRARMAELGITSADVRTWARSAGHSIPDRGVPAAALVDLYVAHLRGDDPKQAEPAAAPAPPPLPAPAADPLAVVPPRPSDEYSVAPEAAAPEVDPEPSERTCRHCGCTQARACPGGCWWVGPDECSACTAPVIPEDIVAAALGPAVDQVLVALEDIVTTTAQLLEAHRAVAAYRTRRLQALAGELLAVLDTPTTAPIGGRS